MRQIKCIFKNIDHGKNLAKSGCVSIQVRYRKGPQSAHAEQYAQTKTNINPNRYRRRCPDPNARIQKFIRYMAIAAICDSRPHHHYVGLLCNAVQIDRK